MKLFEPIKINRLELKNRIVLAPMAIGVAHIGDGKETEKVINHYVKRAKGGAGTIMIGAVSCSYLLPEEELGQPIPPSQYIDGMSHLVAEVHKYGAKIGVQLLYSNQYPLGANITATTSQEWVAPSSVTKNEIALFYIPVDRLRELTINEIDKIILGFARASARLKSIGADFVELHLAHGHLPNQFFSPAINHRSDRYGGNLYRRMTFGLECIRTVKKAVGNDYPVFVRLGAVDERSGGITLPDSIEFARELEKAGVDCIDTSIGVSTKRSYVQYVQPTSKEPPGTYIPIAEAIKRAVKVPVIGVGRINTPEIAENILCKDQADMVAIGRQLLCDSNWPVKVAGGDTGHIIACRSCNQCCDKGVEDLYRDFTCKKRVSLQATK